MWERNKLSLAVSAALATATAGASCVALAESEARGIEEVIVTATKRAESTQDIAVSVSALQGDALEELRISSFDDYIQHLPNVVMMGVGPGQSEIYIRGAATEQSKNTIASIQGSSPATALYVDEQPVSFGGRNLDVYAADLNRIEVLPGPQGTLFGASSQSGTVRLITNKPDPTRVEAGIDIGASTTKGGDISNSQVGYFNMPLSDRAALRVVGYRDSQAGWIDNILNDPDNGGFSPSIDLLNRNDISASPVNPASTFEAADNSHLVEDDFNDADYLGGRVGLSFDVSEDWSVLVQHVQQSLETDGVFAYDPNLDGKSSANRFTLDSTEDEFGLTMLSVEGRAGMLDLIYAAGYLDREVDAYVDYTDYTNGGGYQVYYLCPGYADDGTWARSGAASTPVMCHDPEAQYQEFTDNRRWTHEFRISTPDEHRARLTAGVYYDDQKTQGVGAFEDAATYDDGDGAWPAMAMIGDVGPGTNSPSTPYNPKVTFVNDYTRDIEQIAVFGHIEFDLSNDVTASLGARWYDLDFGFKGASSFSFGCKYAPLDEVCDSSVTRGGFDATSRTSGNNVTARMAALGQGTLEALMAAGRDSCRPDVRDTSACRGGVFSRGMDFSAAQSLYEDIQDGSFNIDDLNDDGVLNESDVILRASLDWRVNDSMMVFATYGQGFRHGVTNRNAGVGARNPRGLPAYDGYRVPAIAETDEMETWELGMKGDFADNTLRLNATAYFSEITDLQVSRFDPANVAFLVFIENVGDAEVMGLDADFTWLPTPNLTISGAVSLLDSEITRINAQLHEISVPEGSELPFSPDFAGSLRARYDFVGALFDGQTNTYVSGSISYSGKSKSGIAGSAFLVEDTLMRSRGRGSGLSIANEGGLFAGGNCGTYDAPSFCPNGRYVQDSYLFLDLAVGVERINWSAELFVDNVADKRAQLNIDTLQYVPKVVTNRPRTIGLRFSYDFDG